MIKMLISNSHEKVDQHRPQVPDQKVTTLPAQVRRDQFTFILTSQLNRFFLITCLYKNIKGWVFFYN